MSALFYICLCSSYNWYKKEFFTVMNPEIFIILLHISSQICPKTIQLIVLRPLSSLYPLYVVTLFQQIALKTMLQYVL